MGPKEELALFHSSDAVPLAAIATAAVTGIPLTTNASLASGSVPFLLLPTGESLHGGNTLLRHFGRVADLYGKDTISAAQVDEWIDYAPSLSVGSAFEKACTHIDIYLATRTFLVSNCLSIADIAILAGLASSGQRWERLQKSTKFPNLSRWYSSLLNGFQAIVDAIAKHAPKKGAGRAEGYTNKEAKKAALVKGEKEKVEGSFEIDLPDAEVGKFCTRFPPEPSGYLHIGHAKAALLNLYFAQKYQGRLLIRFDDTNPAKESNEFVESILEDLETLGVKGDKLSYTSDYFSEMMELVDKLIGEGKAYVDDTPKEEMQRQRMEGIESKCRNRMVDESIALWKEMVAGTERGLQCCVRGKLDMQAANKSLRDPVYYRCNPMPHHRVGDKYKVYPTYDFACPYVDSIEGVTHALRSSEYHDRQDQYYRVLQDMGLRKVHVWDYSRLNMVYTLLSKRKLQWFVDNGKVEGWDDPRFPTVRGILRRGLTIEALKEFMLSQGASKNINLMEWDKLWTINKKIIDPVCPRHTAVVKAGAVLFLLKDGPDEPFVRIIPRHKKHEAAGKKATTFTKQIWLEAVDALAVYEGEEVTLMDWGNAVVEAVRKDGNGNVIGLEGRLHLEGSVKGTKLKLTWLPDLPELVNLSLVELDYLILKKKLEKDDDFVKVLNPVTRWEIPTLGDANMRNLRRGEIIQLERKGYYICDVPYIRPSKPITLLSIPDGRQRPPPGELAPKES